MKMKWGDIYFSSPKALIAQLLVFSGLLLFFNWWIGCWVWSSTEQLCECCFCPGYTQSWQWKPGENSRETERKREREKEKGSSVNLMLNIKGYLCIYIYVPVRFNTSLSQALITVIYTQHFRGYMLPWTLSSQKAFFQNKVLFYYLTDIWVGQATDNNNNITEKYPKPHRSCDSTVR